MQHVDGATLIRLTKDKLKQFGVKSSSHVTQLMDAIEELQRPTML